MSCFKRKEIAWFILKGKRDRKVVVLGHDKRDPLGWLFVVFPRTRHVSRVPKRWLGKIHRH